MLADWANITFSNVIQNVATHSATSEYLTTLMKASATLIEKFEIKIKKYIQSMH